MLPNQFAVEKTVVAPHTSFPGNVTFVGRAFHFFSFHIIISWKFVSSLLPHYIWLAIIPSAFLSIVTSEIAAAVATPAATDATATAAATTTNKSITHLHWRFFVIGLWWACTFLYYLDHSTRNVYELIIKCCPSPMVMYYSSMASEKTMRNAIHVVVLMLKIILIKICLQIGVACAECRPIRHNEFKTI